MFFEDVWVEMVGLVGSVGGVDSLFVGFYFGCFVGLGFGR